MLESDILYQSCIYLAARMISHGDVTNARDFSKTLQNAESNRPQ